MDTVIFIVPAIRPGETAERVERALTSLDGVRRASVHPARRSVTIAYDADRVSAWTLARVVESEGASVAGLMPGGGTGPVPRTPDGARGHDLGRDQAVARVAR